MAGVLTTIQESPQVIGYRAGQARQAGRGGQPGLGTDPGRRLTSYRLAGGLFWLLVSVRAWHSTVAADFGQHAAAVERVRADWLHPANPLLDLPAHSSPYFTPYTVALGLIAKATGLAGWEILKACGPLNLAVVVTGIGAFTRTLSNRRRAPVLALAAYVLLWGPVYAQWSGFLGLQSLTRGVSYPSALAVGLTFHVWALTRRFTCDGAGPWAHVGLGVLTGLVLLVHPFTAMGALVGMVALIIGGQRRWARAPIAGRWALTGAVAFAVAAWWPYFSVFALAGDPTVDPVHRLLYQHLWAWYGLALAGLPALVRRARRDLFDPLAVMFALGCAIAAYGWFSGHYAYGRIFGLLLVPLQFSLAVELAEAPPWTWRHRLLGLLAAVAACSGLVAQAGALVPRRYEPVVLQRLPQWPSYRWAAGAVRPGDTVLAHGYHATRALPAYGVFLVAPTWPDPSVPAALRARRAAAVRAYFAAGTGPDEQSRLARDYHVRWVLTEPGDRAPADGVLAATGRATGERLYQLSPRAPSDAFAAAYGSCASPPTDSPGRTTPTSGSPPVSCGPAR